MHSRWRCGTRACPCLPDCIVEEIIHNDAPSLDQVFYVTANFPASPGNVSFSDDGRATASTCSGSIISLGSPSSPDFPDAAPLQNPPPANEKDLLTSCSRLSSCSSTSSPSIWKQSFSLTREEAESDHSMLEGNSLLPCSRKRLDLITGPGDVLVIKGTDRLSLVGAAGGFAGHVALVVSTPTFILEDSPEADDIRDDWPELKVWPLWRVTALESTRLTAGINQADLLLYIQEDTGLIELIGEHNPDGCIEYEREATTIWQAPGELRKHFRIDLMTELVSDMTDVDANWCWATAARAFLLPATISDELDSSTVLHEAQEGWAAKPICTSVVVAFWQRYLCTLSEHAHVASERQVQPNSCFGPADLILKWMPLRADQTLPKDLLDAMLRCGWIPVLKVPLRNSL